MVENALRFYKGWYGKGSNKTLPEDSKAIIFNEEEGILYVNGHSYSGATDVTFSSGVLTFSFTDGRTPITLDFNDTASASATLKVFERIDSIIGENLSLVNSDGKLNYEGTTYLDGDDSDSDDGAKTLVEADRILDSEIKNVNDRIDDLNEVNIQGVLLTPANGSTGAKLDFVGVSQNKGRIELGNYAMSSLQFAKLATSGLGSDVSYSNSTSQMQATNVQSAIDELDSRLKSQESLDTFDTVISSDAATTPYGVSWVQNSETITGTLTASSSTMHKIYLVPDTNTTAEHTGTYNEYITVRTGSENNYSYGWELIGSTKADLTGYVKTININGKEYSVGSNTTAITLGTDVITGITGESTTDLNNTDFVNVKATTVKDTTLGTDITTLVSSVKTVAIADATNNNNGLVTALDVKNTIEGLDTEVYSASASDSDMEPFIVGVSQTNGLVSSVEVITLGADVVYDSTNHTLSVSEQNGMVLGSDVTALKDYIDYKAGASATTVTNSNGNNDAISLTTTTGSDGHTNYDINLVWSEWGSNSEI